MGLKFNNMNWQLVIPGLIILAIKLVGMSLFIVYFPQIFPTLGSQRMLNSTTEGNRPVSQIFSTDDSTENSWSSTSSGRTNCPIRWTFQRGKCYFFSVQEKTWNASQRACSEANSSLVIINSKEELEFLHNNTKAEDYFIGLSVGGAEGRWKWIDNTELNTDIFMIPLNSDTFACVVIGLTVVGTISCSVPNRWICEKKA
ncbi:C-type lectin domain family 5 member A-like isoform X2 [Mauremys reevesii]|uniref:C-type lectin domain family 5 member A-like isoform X2 n=1 Tax=Mauremys reevesii TaxID=260615 RepID=UPI00193FA136|nr:C-type lectin domain family 5 member A-like isoform X2 [Mauremys reevesii]